MQGSSSMSFSLPQPDFPHIGQHQTLEEPLMEHPYLTELDCSPVRQ